MSRARSAWADTPAHRTFQPYWVCLVMLPRIIIAVFVIVVVGFGVFLATWDMPPPSATVERTLPNDRLKP